jgi:DNA-binding transcriptional LysR family regulator
MELAEPVRSGLTHLRNAFDEQARFDPAVSTRSFRLALTDYAELLVLGALLGRLERSAPDVQIVVRRPVRIFVPPEGDLATGRFDLAIGFYPEQSALDPSTQSHDLFAEDHVCIARRGHPLMRSRFGLREFAAARHVGIFYRPDARGLIDNILATHGLRRCLLAALPDFLSVPNIVAQSDLIAVVPAGLAAHYGMTLPLAVRKVPMEFPRMTMRLLWNIHADSDPAHRWLRSEILECARSRSGRGSKAI